jgi:hypothetical protein
MRSLLELLAVLAPAALAATVPEAGAMVGAH